MEIKTCILKNQYILIKINSPLLRNDFQMCTSFYLKTFQNKFRAEKFNDLQIL